MRFAECGIRAPRFARTFLSGNSLGKRAFFGILLPWAGRPGA